MEKGVRRRVQEDVKFGKYIKALREKCGYSMRQLCEGLCTFQEIACLESGKHRPEKLLQDAVLERLGVGSEDREHFLGYVAYDRWKIRQRIFHAITFEQTQRAEELLEEYARVYCSGQASTTGMRGMVERLERQFYLGMKAQVRRCQGSSREELGELFQEAVELTVPESEQKSLDELVLSIRELNLMLEAEYGRGEGERPERYLEALDYLEKRHFDRVGRGKVYPKAVYFLCRCILDRKASSDGLFQEEWDEARLLKYCDKALDILRDIRRMYYFWEILVIREKLLEEKAGVCETEDPAREALQSLCRENRECRHILEEIYEESGVPRETFEFCYLYVVREAYCINDLVALRRRMLGISLQELCRDICDIKTLKRLERRETVPQRMVVGGLLERLGLPTEFNRTDLGTGDPEAVALLERIKESSNEGAWEKAVQFLEQLGQKISGELRNNRQFLMKEQAVLLWKQKKIGTEEYCRRMREALELTLPLEAFLSEGKKYLTNMEQTCIQNLMQGMDRDSREFRICVRRFEEMYQPLIEEGLQEAVSGMYEHVMGFIGSEWGDKGEYDRADMYSGIIMQGCLRFRRNAFLHKSLYDRWWNYSKRIEEGIPVDKKLDDEKELRKCILLSRMGRQHKIELFYQKKLNVIMNK